MSVGFGSVVGFVVAKAEDWEDFVVAFGVVVEMASS